MPAEPQPDPKIVDAITAVSEKAALLVREEIELAKAEIELKVKSLVRGIAIAFAAGIFVAVGLLYALHGLSWFFYWLVPVPNNQFFWGFFMTAAIMFLLAALAAFIAARLLKSGQNPAPTMAIEEAQKIKETFAAGGEDKS